MPRPDPDFLGVLTGRNVFGLDPADETRLARACAVVGFLLGLWLGWWL